MKDAGLYLFIAGVGSILLNQFGYEFKLLMWIDNWGEAVGWVIRGGAIVAGAALFLIAKSAEPKEAEQEA
ncbi:MAG: hypothetical protein IME93_05620 [Proteobacteria bacterium]|nr:hypothetical protein [Pseudomonadota bacterium]